MRLGFEHSYAALPARFFTDAQPAPVPAPRTLVFNDALADALGLDVAAVRADAHRLLSGAGPPADARPLAMAYAGHQFGHFVPALGDGRALLLGELRGRDGRLSDLQLKGAGRTAWSRGGDGLAAVGPMLREYLVSEAMHALRIPTTRSLAVVATGDVAQRETVLPGAILARVAASHVRVGTFEYFAARGDREALSVLLRYCVARHFPALDDDADLPIAFLHAVADRQAALVADWASVGFIHGVMNTDNMAISGETIDYGPCAFMDHYDPATVFSSIDRRGRYAYGNQPAIAQWNLARLAECLLALVPGDPDVAVARLTDVVQAFGDRYQAEWLQRFRHKLGLATADPGDAALVADLLSALQQAGLDFTLTFRGLADAIDSDGDAVLQPWLARWRVRLAREGRGVEASRAALRAANPAYIPRNHRVEAALAAASDHGDLAAFTTLLGLVQRPFDEHRGFEAWRQPAAEHERVQATFCGT